MELGLLPVVGDDPDGRDAQPGGGGAQFGLGQEPALRLGFAPPIGRQVAQRGSHRQFRHPVKPGRVTVAGNPGQELAPGTLGSILRQAGLSREDR